MPRLPKEISQVVLDELPQLRRYARALTGAQARGDAYVALCLESLLQDGGISDASDARLQLFAAFHEGLAAVRGGTLDAGDEGRDDPVRHSLRTLSHRERAILLMADLEGFSFPEMAYILDAPETALRASYEAAREKSQERKDAAVLIIEDEPLIAMDLAEIVTKMGHRPCGMVSRASEAVEVASQTKPSLILADVMLKGGDSGIDTVLDILRRVDAPVIFVTGYPEALLTGLDVEPTFVVAKPFEIGALETMISQALAVTWSKDPMREPVPYMHSPGQCSPAQLLV